MKQIILSLLLICALPVLAQETVTVSETLITDRPDATESPYTVGKGNFQIETGALFTENGNDDLNVKQFVFNTGLLRYGLSDNFELRLGWDYQNERLTSQGRELSDATGFTPLLVGGKIEITDENGWIPQIGLMTHLRLPFTAVTEFKPEQTGMEMIFSFDHTLSNSTSIAYNLGARVADNRSIEYLYTVAYGFDITKKFGAYIELYGAFPEDTTAYHLWDAGCTYLVNNNLQLDVTVGTGFNSTAAYQNILLSAGFSYRILKK